MKVVTLVFHSILALIGIGFLLICILETTYITDGTERDKEFIEKNMKPAVNFVASFYTKNKALPNLKQFEAWKESKGWGNRGLHLDPKNDVTGRFEISAWRGEWYENYQSWTDDYTADDIGYFYIALYLIFGSVLTYFGFSRIGKIF